MTGDVEAVAAALDGVLTALRGHPGDVAMVAALDQARAAVADVDDELTRGIVARMLTEVERCHRVGAASSPRLEAWCRTPNVALYIASRRR